MENIELKSAELWLGKEKESTMQFYLQNKPNFRATGHLAEDAAGTTAAQRHALFQSLSIARKTPPFIETDRRRSPPEPQENGYHLHAE